MIILLQDNVLVSDNLVAMIAVQLNCFIYITVVIQKHESLMMVACCVLPYELDSDTLPVFRHILGSSWATELESLELKQNVDKSTKRKRQADINDMPHLSVIKLWIEHPVRRNNVFNAYFQFRQLQGVIMSFVLTLHSVNFKV